MIIKELQHFFAMGGYAYYVWPAYAALFVFFIVQWYVPWRKWKKYQKTVKVQEKQKYESYS